MDSLLLVSLLYEVVGKKEFQEGLVDLLYVTAKNKEEASDNPFVKIPNSDSEIYNYAFWKDSSLTFLNIPNSITRVWSYAFYRCSSLTCVNIPNSVTIIGSYAFEMCSNLKSISIPKRFETDIEDIFDGINLSRVKITYT